MADTGGAPEAPAAQIPAIPGSHGSARRVVTADANEAAASVAHRSAEVIAIYPITPSSPMAESCDEWSAAGRGNLWGAVPRIVQMQSEGGVAGAVHGALLAGALTTTFTASQGLLLMIPNMYKIAGELLPFVLHVAARTIATHSLSIFGDHSDVMACRQTGFAMLCAGNAQEAQDFAAISTAATLESRVPFIHFFDGFRTSHEIGRYETLDDADLLALYDAEAIAAHRRRALTPDRPQIRGTAANPDTWFQSAEAANPFHERCPEVVRSVMDRFAARTGRRYRLFDYEGHPEAERVIVMMGSGAECAAETVAWLVARGERVGVLKVRLYRPFAADAFLAAMPRTARSVAVLDRTKEPGAPGEPLHLDVVAALAEARAEGRLPFDTEPRVIAGRYGLSGKEFTPAMVKAVFDALASEAAPRRFTVGIHDDVSRLSLPFDAEFDIEPDDVVRALFFGLGSDGTVGSNKNTIKIIGEATPLHAQGYFVYDSKKAGAVTVSNLRFGPRPIRSTYRIRRANFVACHQTQLIERLDVLGAAAPEAVFLLNTPAPPEQAFDSLPREVQEAIVSKRLRFFVIDAHALAKRIGLGRHISTIMQACFFGLSGVLPRDAAVAAMRKAIDKAYGKRGIEVLRRNYAAVDEAITGLREATVPGAATALRRRPPAVPAEAPDFVQRVTGAILAGRGDDLPVSAFPVDGAWPVGTTRWEKRAIAQDIPVWDASLCIQCGKCAFVCPHAAIRAKAYGADRLDGAPATFKSAAWKAGDAARERYTIQVAPEDCTGCSLCVTVCPAKDKSNPRHKAIDMMPFAAHRDAERESFSWFETIPARARDEVTQDVKGSQLVEPLFEFSGACAGCGETPYVKLLSQLFGDRLVVANATGCSSIYGGNLPTTPWRAGADGRGPAWANSLFEDNAEFGLGIRLALDAHSDHARDLVRRLAGSLGDELAVPVLEAPQDDERGIAEQRRRIAALKERLAAVGGPDAARLALFADWLVRKSLWIVGGDGWAYDIGFGGLDHVLSTRHDVNVLVLDTEVYSNTGGQQSKATPAGASAKFASAGKETGKKNLGRIAMTYGHVYVAGVAFTAKDAQTVRAFAEADSYRGPSLVIAHSPCIAHGYDMWRSPEQQRLAVESGVWPLYRFDPRRAGTAEPRLRLDSGPPKASVAEYMRNEGRFRVVELKDPERYARIVAEADASVRERRAAYERMATADPAASQEGGAR
ncbi:MAG: Pyruvate-flavodoxin oxidoreductase [Planctomycetes bacterium]|nr:Pyruvate-flavodoxin oxidoreductase [Planctomycetota bacterium]